MSNTNQILEQHFPNSETIKVPRRTLLLKEGERSKNLFLIKEGIVRMWFNQDGKDITFQFFFEGSPISSIESLLENTPSLFNIETINSCVVRVIKKEHFLGAINESRIFEKLLYKKLSSRLFHYQKLFLSRIKDSPQERYKELLEQHPEIFLNIPQHYIASYLGITSVSLSRIRNRKNI